MITEPRIEEVYIGLTSISLSHLVKRMNILGEDGYIAMHEPRASHHFHDTYHVTMVKKMTVSVKQLQEKLAKKWAYNAHEGQEYKSGVPYTDHLEEVVDNTTHSLVGAKAAAWLHDILEDTHYTTSDLITFEFGWGIGSAVETLTRHTDETYREYITRVAQHPLAVAVKLADLTANIAACLHEDCPPEKIKLLEKYREAQEWLMSGELKRKQYDDDTP